MRLKVSKNNFSSGEIGPLLYGRADTSQYSNGVRELSNFLVKQQGGISKRQGTRLLGSIIDELKKCRLKRFVYSNDQAYMLEFSEYKVRITRDEGYLTETAVNITGATAANPVVITTSTSHGYSNGDIVTISSVGGMTELNGNNYTVNNVAGTTFELRDFRGNNIDGSSFTAYTSGGTVEKHVTLTTPWDEDDIEGITFSQTNDVMYVASELYRTRKISRLSDTSWTIEEVFTSDGPYGAENKTTTTLTPAATTGASVAVTASVSLFASTDVGRLLRLHHDSSTPIAGWGTIVSIGAGVTLATLAAVSISSAFGATTATAVWRPGAFSDATGYPANVSFHENRLIFGGTTTEPNTFWGSKTDDYENFEPTNPTDLVVADDNGYRAPIVSEQNDAIQWIRSGPLLFIGAKSGQYVARSSGAAITPSDISVKKQNGFGASIVEPHFISSSMIYIDRSTRKIMEMVYDFDQDAFQANEISVIANHILRQGERAIYTTYQQAPDNIIWYCLENGRLVGMTYLKEQQILAFHNHDIAGEYESETVTSGDIIEDQKYIIKSVAGGADFTNVGASANTIGISFTATGILPTWGSGSLAKVTNAEVVAIDSVPSSDGLYDVIHVVVKRTINGVTRQYHEYFYDNFYPKHDQDKSGLFFVDSGLEYSGAATSTITGLDHLEGQVVTVVAGEATHPDRTVTSGSITLDASYTNVKVGLGYTAKCRMLPAVFSGDIGSNHGSQKRGSEITVRFWNSLGFQCGDKLTNLDDITFRSSTDRMDRSPPLLTGDKKILLADSYDSEGDFYIQQNKPFPCNILMVTTEYRSNQ